MSRRVSSREDLFLSALDMYTLLSLVFIGMAFMATEGGVSRSTLELLGAESKEPPRVPLERTPLMARPADPATPWLAWDRPSDEQGVAERCVVRISQRGPAGLQRLRSGEVPCAPAAFAEAPTGRAVDSRLQDLVNDAVPTRPKAVVVQCRRGQLAACARLQWLAIEQGLKVYAVVENQQRP